jgi:hypothetical protein
VINNNIDGITQTEKCNCDHCEQNNNIDSIMKNTNQIQVEDKQDDQTIIPVVQQLAS